MYTYEHIIILTRIPLTHHLKSILMETFTSALLRTIRNNTSRIQTQNEENENKLINFEISNEDYYDMFVVLLYCIV